MNGFAPCFIIALCTGDGGLPPFSQFFSLFMAWVKDLFRKYLDLVM